MLDISLVLYNSSAHLPALVESLLRQAVPLKDIALLVVDNASTDGSAALLEKLLAPHRENFRDVKIIHSPENLGFGRGHNLGVREGSAPFLFLLNPDAELAPDTLSTLIAAAGNDPSAAAWEARQSPYEHPKIYDPVTLETPWVSGAGVLLRRSAFEQVKGFDEKIFLYGEDVDLSLRLREAGHLLRYCPRATFTHRSYSKPGETKPQQFIGSIRANLCLRTRFGTWRDIGAGVTRQLALLPAAPRVDRQGRMVAANLRQWLKDFSHWRNGAARTLRHHFRGWEYAPHRNGAFHDVSAGLALRERPKVSILIRTIGRQALLGSALGSIANQTYPNIETVVVEDGPATLDDFLKPWQEKLSVVYHPLGEKRGRCLAGNAALAAATGEYCLFLDEDDLLYADHVEQLVAGVLAQKARVAYSFAFELPSSVSPEGVVLEEGDLFCRFPWKFSFPRLLNSNYIPIQSVLFSRALYQEHGGFDPDIPYNEDWNLWVRYAIAARPFALVPKVTSIYRVPLDHAENSERHAVMLEHRDRVRALHRKLDYVLTEAELKEIEAPAPERIGLRDSLIARYPRFRTLFVLAAYVRRRFA